MPNTVTELFDSMSLGPAPESAQLAQQWLEAHGRSFGHFVQGKFLAPGAQQFVTENPANRKPLARVTQGLPRDVDQAVRAAAKAQRGWWALGGAGRARHLYALARHLQRESRLFAVLESLDNGKPIRESRDVDLPLVARHFYYHAGWASLLESEFAGFRALGVVGQIVPWNFPLLMLAWKIAPALAAGNTVVLKPAEFTPLTALLFGQMCQRAGLPPGVVNIVTGDGSTGQALVAHPGVAKIAFTGSTEVGRLIRVATAGTGKRLSLELGGKSPFVVFDDADLDSVVEGVVDAIWFNQGEVCCAGSRLLAQEPIADRLAEKLRARMETLRIGDPLDKAVDIGAIIAPVQLDKIRRLVEQGKQEGAVVWQPTNPCPADGLFFPPTLITDVAPANTVAQVEIFGPVVAMMTFRTPDEAVQLANNTRYGLAASVWTDNVNTALDVARRIKAGTVWINGTNQFDASSCFGGYRESGFGREGGREGMYEYLGRPVAARIKKAPVGTARAARSNKPEVDRTYKLLIGGKQVRPDSGYVTMISDRRGRPVAEVGAGNRKDLRNAVAAARAAAGKWAGVSAHGRAQILYYLGENVAVRAAELGASISRLTGVAPGVANAEVASAIQQCFWYAAWADKFDGRVATPAQRAVTLVVPEPLGVIAIVAPETPTLAGCLGPLLAAVALGNAVVLCPSERWPLPALDLIQVIDTSDLPAGVINLVTGPRAELVPVLAQHDDVDGLWCFADPDRYEEIERLSAGNLKRTFLSDRHDWIGGATDDGTELLREASQVKSIWIPYGA